MLLLTMTSLTQLLHAATGSKIDIDLLGGPVGPPAAQQTLAQESHWQARDLLPQF
jgi:hypothetical protein